MTNDLAYLLTHPKTKCPKSLFYETFHNHKNTLKEGCEFVAVSHCHLSLITANIVIVAPHGAPLKGQVPSLTLKYKTRVDV